MNIKETPVKVYDEENNVVEHINKITEIDLLGVIFHIDGWFAGANWLEGGILKKTKSIYELRKFKLYALDKSNKEREYVIEIPKMASDMETYELKQKITSYIEEYIEIY